MLPLSAIQSVSLDVLNNYNESIARFDACLQHLHGDWASLTLPTHAPLSLVHWGTQVRFCLSDGVQGYEAFGVVVARDAEKQAAVRQDAEPTATASPAILFPEKGLQALPAVKAQDVREVVVRLYQCSPFGERRAGPRRWTRFGVRLLLLPTQASSSSSLAAGATEAVSEYSAPPERAEVFLSQQASSERFASPLPDTGCWERGWAVDISGGGMRLRTYARLPLRQRIALQFWLPDARARQAASHASRFEVVGRVLRSQRTRSRASLHEAMLCFEQLSPKDGLALEHFLSLHSQIPCYK